MDFNFKIPHATGEIVVGVTGGNPNAAFAAVQMGHEIAAMLGAAAAGAPVDIEPDEIIDGIEETAAHEQALRAYEPVKDAQTIINEGHSAVVAQMEAAGRLNNEDDDDDCPEVDSAGTPFDPELHTGTLKKDGTWRLKKGAAAKEESEPEGNEPSAPDAEAALEAPSPDMNIGEPAAADLPEITDAELQRYCGRLAERFKTMGHKEPAPLIYKLAENFVPEGEMPRPTNIKDQAARHAFVKQAEAETGVRYHG